MLKTVSSITNAIGALNYKGTWNASTNTPTLADGTGTKGDYYVVSAAGTQTFDGILLFFGAGDWIVYNGAVWQRVEGGSDGNFSNVTLNSTDAGATAGPLLDLYRNSATPAASDTIGEIEFNGKDSAGNKQQYAVIHGSILSPTSTTEQGQIHFETATAGASTEKMIIGTTNLVINEIGAVFNVRIEGDADANLFYTDATNDRIGVGTTSPAVKFDVVGTAAVSGNLLVGTTSLLGSGKVGVLKSTAGQVLVLQNSVVPVLFGDAPYGISISYTGGAPNDTQSEFLYFDDNTPTLRMSVRSNGGIANYTANNVILSDRREKTNFAPAGSYLDKICAIPVQTFNYIDQNLEQDGGLTLGVVAQDVQAVAPELVSESNWAAKDQPEKMRLEIYQTDLQYALMKCIQEQQALIESLATRLTALENK